MSPDVYLERSLLKASAVAGRGGDVVIRPGRYFRSMTEIDVSSTFGTSGEVIIEADQQNPRSEVTIPPPAKLNVAIQEICPEVVGPATYSTFTVMGRGGEALAAGGWLPEIGADSVFGAGARGGGTGRAGDPEADEWARQLLAADRRVRLIRP